MISLCSNGWYDGKIILRLLPRPHKNYMNYQAKFNLNWSMSSFLWWWSLLQGFPFFYFTFLSKNSFLPIKRTFALHWYLNGTYASHIGQVPYIPFQKHFSSVVCQLYCLWNPEYPDSFNDTYLVLHVFS